MAAMRTPPKGKKYFTPAEANASLPLVRAIVTDVTRLAAELRDRHERLVRFRPREGSGLLEAHREELLQMQAELERGEEQMREYEKELQQLGIELKDYLTGLVDFPCRMNGRDVYLCWRLGEPSVAHWHELEAGFAGRQRLLPEMSRT
jgi:hypothetical protein